jgi:hypothetical protein
MSDTTTATSSLVALEPLHTPLAAAFTAHGVFGMTRTTRARPAPAASNQLSIRSLDTPAATLTTNVRSTSNPPTISSLDCRIIQGFVARMTTSAPLVASAASLATRPPNASHALARRPLGPTYAANDTDDEEDDDTNPRAMASAMDPNPTNPTRSSAVASSFVIAFEAATTTRRVNIVQPFRRRRLEASFVPSTTCL